MDPETELKAAEDELKRCEAEEDIEAVNVARNRVDGLRNAATPKSKAKPKGK